MNDKKLWKKFVESDGRELPPSQPACVRSRPTAPGPLKLPRMAKKFPLHPKHPERICWGCDRYCAKDALMCGNGSGRTQHPAEMLGDDWYQWGDWGIEPDDNDPSAAAPLGQ